MSIQENQFNEGIFNNEETFGVDNSTESNVVEGLDENTQELINKTNRAKKRKRNIIIIVSILVAVTVLVTGLCIYKHNEKMEKAGVQYKEALSLIEAKKYEEAKSILSTIEYYDNSTSMINICDEEIYKRELAKADELYKEGKLMEASQVYSEIGENLKADEMMALERKLYIEDLSFKLYKLNRSKEISCTVGDVMYKNWIKADLLGTNATTEIDTELRGTYAKEYAELESGREEVRALMKEIGELAGAEEAHNLMLDIHEVYEKIQALLTNLSGTPYEFTTSLSDYSKEFDVLVEKLFIVEKDMRTTLEFLKKSNGKLENGNETHRKYVDACIENNVFLTDAYNMVETTQEQRLQMLNNEIYNLTVKGHILAESIKFNAETNTYDFEYSSGGNGSVGLKEPVLPTPAPTEVPAEATQVPTGQTGHTGQTVTNTVESGGETPT